MSLQHATFNSTSPEESSPEEAYAQKVLAFSKLDVADAYFSGIHYNRLAKFLFAPYQRYGVEENKVVSDNSFAFVTLCNLAEERESDARTKDFCTPKQFSQYLQDLRSTTRHNTEQIITNEIDTKSVLTNPISNRCATASQSKPRLKHPGLLLFMRGFPSPAWLNHLGAALDIDPEFFFRHLEVKNGNTSDSYQIGASYRTPFPNSKDLITLRMCNTGSWSTSNSPVTLGRLREGCEISMNQQLDNFKQSRNMVVGNSIVRQFVLHDLQTFSIMQQASIEIIYHTNTWSAIIWMDPGNDLSHCNSGPWLDSFTMAERARLHPVFQHRSRMCSSLNKSNNELLLLGQERPNQRYPQSVHHIHENYGRYLKKEIMAHDSFYALHELFEFSAASIDQLLEVIEDNVCNWTVGFTNPEKLSELLLAKSLLIDYRRYVKEILEVIFSRGGPKWPRANDPKQRQKADRAANHIESRYELLLKRCDRLTEQCSDKITIITNAETQHQTERGIEQTDRLKKLSVLAYFYIPLSFAASFFGMNFQQLGTQLDIGYYFSMSVPLLIASVIAWYIDIKSVSIICLRLTKHTFQSIKRWWSWIKQRLLRRERGGIV